MEHSLRVAGRRPSSAPPLTMPGEKNIVQNRRARFEYFILDSVEAGIALSGTEVKSLRAGKANLQDAYAAVERGEVWLHQAHISPYEQGNRFNVDPRRKRKLLLKKREIYRLVRQVNEKGLTLIPLRLYFKNGYVKVEIGLARGKRLYDKREAIKEKDEVRRLEQEG